MAGKSVRQIPFAKSPEGWRRFPCDFLLRKDRGMYIERINEQRNLIAEFTGMNSIALRLILWHILLL